MFQNKFARMSNGKNVRTFPNRFATMFQEKSAGVFQEKSVSQFQSRNVRMFPGKCVRLNVRISTGAKSVKMLVLLWTSGAE